MKYKILLLNIGYFSGLNGSIIDYIFKSYRYIFPSKKIINKIAGGFKGIVAKENPDIICLVEIRKKQIKYFLNREYKFYDVDTKYSPNGIAVKIPILKEQGDAFMSKERVNFQKFFLKNGTKKLVYSIDIPGGIKLMLFHFALGKKARAKQFQEVKKLVANGKKTILCGDFNIFNGLSELDDLVNGAGLEIIQKEPTFPAYNPNKILDLFLTTKGIVAKARVIRTGISDHLPVVLEIDY